MELKNDMQRASKIELKLVCPKFLTIEISNENYKGHSLMTDILVI
jgi:hypothetical protein